LCARLVVATVATVARNNRDTEVAVARQPSETGSAEESDVPLEELEIDAEADDLDDDVDDADASERSAASDALWTDVRVQPVEIALPSGVGFTLRAYRLSTDVREPELGDREDDLPLRGVPDDVELDEADLPAIDEDELTAQALAAGRDGEPKADADADGDDEDTAKDRTVAPVPDVDEDEKATVVDADDTDAEDEAEEEEPAEPEEVPVFLAERGKLLLFRSAEGLVEYVRGTHDHELAQLDSWAELRDRIEAEDIVPLDEDRYELDLVVENLRGGHDAVDPELIIQAGELSRDIGYALRLQAVVNALAPGSPLDDLDEGLRAVETGGFRSFFARRRVRKIEAQTTAALGWRTVIGKISAVVDWRN
jgi:hypothetical protein